jgi:hypothetical protein
LKGLLTPEHAPVEPFKITCVTCRARLAVRNESLIGQILACPKCGSMVQVAPPAVGSVSDASASGIVLGAAAVAPANASLASATFDDVAEAASDAPAVSPPPPPPPAAPRAPRQPASVAPTAAGWSTTKLAVFAAVSAVAGSALVAGAISFLRSPPDAAPPLVAEDSPAADAPTDPRIDDPIDAPPEVQSNPSDEASVEPAPPAAPPEDNPFAAPSESAAASATNDAASGSSPPAVPTPPGAEAAVIPKADPPAPAVDAAAPRLRIDPLELDPEGMDLSTLTRGRAADSLAASQLDKAPAPVVVASAAPAEAGPMAPPDAAPPDLRFEPAGPPSNIAELLERRLPAVTIESMPLCRFLNFASNLSGMPVSVSPDELQLAAVSAATPVTVDAKNATIEELLASALGPLRLAASVDGPHIVLRRRSQDKRRELAYPVDDLAADDAELQRLAGWVQDLVAPETWKAHGGAGVLTIDGATLRIDNSERSGFETILLLERYRVARGLQPRSKYPPALLSAGAAVGKLRERMQGPATFTFTQPTPLRAVAAWWQEELETAILIDWPALAGERTWPQSRITASAMNEPWGAALAKALAPLGLGWRAVDGRTIEMTSLGKIRTEPQLAIYRLTSSSSGAAAMSGDDLLARVAAAAEAEGAAAGGAAYYDAAHRVLLVRQPAAVQRRLADGLGAAGFLDDAAGD